MVSTEEEEKLLRVRDNVCWKVSVMTMKGKKYLPTTGWSIIWPQSFICLFAAFKNRCSLLEFDCRSVAMSPCTDSAYWPKSESEMFACTPKQSPRFQWFCCVCHVLHVFGLSCFAVRDLFCFLEVVETLSMGFFFGCFFPQYFRALRQHCYPWYLLLDCLLCVIHKF